RSCSARRACCVPGSPGTAWRFGASVLDDCRTGPAGPAPRLAYVNQSGELILSGAREHNLKDVHVRLPRNALIVIPGLPGSDKASLAFHTIYAAGPRRYVESLSAYSR